MIIFNTAAIMLLPTIYPDQAVVMSSSFIHNHILLIITFQIEKMDISFNFQNRSGLLFKLYESGYSKNL